jgi:hypothetical protein
MDRVLARRLENDEDFGRKLLSLAQDYLSLGQQSANYWAQEFDIAHDVLMCYAPITKEDLERLDRGHPKRFILPMTATQITTMTTFVAQMLFGDAQPHKVEARGPEDEESAAYLNQLLRWNDEQQAGYLLGYLWVQDILTYNRGIRYNSWAPIYETTVEMVEALDEETGETYFKPKKRKQAVAGYNKIHLVSPYEFVSDPHMPLWRFQEGRFAGHRSLLSWNDLKQRSTLPMDDPSYVSPKAVEELKKRKKQAGSLTGGSVILGGIASTNTPSSIVSRTQFERSRQLGNTARDANAQDPGIVEMHELYIRLVPEDNDLYDETEPVVLQILMGNRAVILSINEAPNKHDEFPYAVAEGRPSAYYQFSPGWAMMLKPLQDYIDYLKNRRQQSIARTGGNMFVARVDKVNIKDFTDPDKDGLIIPVLPEADSSRLDDIIRQVPVVDQTRDFNNEMRDFMSYSEVVTGVNSAMQGTLTDETTATQFAGTQQMAAGRLSSIARLISVQGLVPETRQLVANFQQFLTVPMTLRFAPASMDSPSTFRGKSSLTINADVIQGRFDYVAHDGSLPGTDTRKVAAISRLLEIVPALPQYFQPAPGNIDARALILAGAKAAGLNIENFQFTEESAAASAPSAPPMPGDPTAAPPPGDPSALLGALSPEPAGPGPGRPPTPSMTEIPSAAPLQIRPNQL